MAPRPTRRSRTVPKQEEAPKAPPKAFSYLRFSTREQSAGDSDRRQTKLAEDYAAKRGWELDTELALQDLGVSAFRGTNRATGALGVFLNAVLTGAVPAGSFLLIESLDRLSRQSAWEALPTLQAIVNADIAVITLSPRERELSRETLTKNPFLIMEVLMDMTRANEESAVKSKRIKAVWENKRAQAPTKVMSAWCPSWLTLDKKTGTFTVHEDRAGVIQRIYGETLLGCSPDSIALALNVEDTPVFEKDGRHKAQRWHRSFINRLLETETVIGTLTPNTISYAAGKMVRVKQEPVPDYYPAVIDKELFQRVRTLRKESRSPMRGKNASKEVNNIFAGGMARCGRCGGSLIRVNKGSGNSVFLVCSAAKAGAGCVYETAPYQRIENAFLANAPRLVARAPAGDKNRKLDKEIETVESTIYGTDDEIDRLLDSLAATRSPSVERRIRRLEKELDSLKSRLGELETQRADSAGPIVRSRLNDLRAAASAKPLNRTHLNALLRQNLARVELDFASRSLTLFWRQGGKGHFQYGLAK